MRDVASTPCQSLQYASFRKVGAVEQRIELRHVRRALLLRSEIRDAQHPNASGWQ